MNVELGKHYNLVRCHACGQVSRLAPKQEHGYCRRCDSHVECRISDSLFKTWALLITAIIFIIPANLFPVMTVVSLGKGTPDTIISGVIALIDAHMYPIAILVFFASILVPMFKIIGLMVLLVAIHFRWRLNHKQALIIYRFIHFIGRWSMLDLFMISILVALVDMNALASISAGFGATCFATVVVVTMLAVHTFDQRLIWGLAEETQSEETVSE